ncbi:hypothetical protein Tcan_17153 [Toxocara canis]|uniref:Uncharacterized protein n=1 Tax=Toxocara canis TaxID=6265 RepID=A0A0B2W057_TOXCA|nr:hypothetical protein Tcan_17153 [Toxocara canis]
MTENLDLVLQLLKNTSYTVGLEDLSQKTTEHSAQQQNDIPSAEVEGQQQRQETIGSSAQQENEKPSAEIKEEPQSQTAAQPVTSFRLTEDEVKQCFDAVYGW